MLHVDAHTITAYLERVLTQVEVLEADSVDVEAERGEVVAVVLDGDGRVAADLDVQHFLDAHYRDSARRDSAFWKYQTTRAYPERLEARLALYAQEMPSDDACLPNAARASARRRLDRLWLVRTARRRSLYRLHREATIGSKRQTVGWAARYLFTWGNK